MRCCARQVTPGSPQAQAFLGGLQERMAGSTLPDVESGRAETALRPGDARSRSPYPQYPVSRFEPDFSVGAVVDALG